MSPKDKITLFEAIAHKLLESYPIGRIQSLLSMYGYSMEFVNYNQEDIEFIFDVLNGGDIDTAIKIAKDYNIPIPGEEMANKTIDNSENKSISSASRKLFISHSSQDKEVVEKIIDFARLIGVKPTDIFCSSFEGYTIGLGEDFLDTIKKELNGNVLVIFVLSPNFYASPVCLCEMGAAWVSTHEHIPVLIPPFEFKDVKGVFPLSQGMMINDKLKLNSFKEKIEQFFTLDQIKHSIWERDRDNNLEIINGLLNRSTNMPSPRLDEAKKRIYKLKSKEERGI